MTAMTADEIRKVIENKEKRLTERLAKLQSERKAELQKLNTRLRERERYEAAKNKRLTDHATFLLFGEMIRHEGIVNFIGKIAENNNFSEKEKEALNLLMKSRGIAVVF